LNDGGRFVRFDDVDVAELGNGFFGKNLVEAQSFELTYITCDEGAGHGFHQHEDLEEILIFLEGSCNFSLGGTSLDMKGGSMIYIPPKMSHKVSYKEKSKVLRIKIAKP
jgi:mannose-6-phosphate isomerase-like protein (cupin superfamily)